MWHLLVGRGLWSWQFVARDERHTQWHTYTHDTVSWTVNQSSAIMLLAGHSNPGNAIWFRPTQPISSWPQWQSSCCNVSDLVRPLLTQCPSAPPTCGGGVYSAATAWSKDEKQWLAALGLTIDMNIINIHDVYGANARITDSNAVRTDLPICRCTDDLGIHHESRAVGPH